MKKIFSFIFILTFVFSYTGTAFADYIEYEEEPGTRGCVTAVLDSVGNVTEKVCDSLFGRPTRRRMYVRRTLPRHPYYDEYYSAPRPIYDGRMEQNVVIQTNSNNKNQETNTNTAQPQVEEQKPQVVNNYYTTKNYNTYKTYRSYKNNGVNKTSGNNRTN